MPELPADRVLERTTPSSSEPARLARLQLGPVRLQRELELTARVSFSAPRCLASTSLRTRCACSRYLFKGAGSSWPCFRQGGARHRRQGRPPLVRHGPRGRTGNGQLDGPHSREVQALRRGRDGPEDGRRAVEACPGKVSGALGLFRGAAEARADERSLCVQARAAKA
mgnify:FL=1